MIEENVNALMHASYRQPPDARAVEPGMFPRERLKNLSAIRRSTDLRSAAGCGTGGSRCLQRDAKNTARPARTRGSAAYLFPSVRAGRAVWDKPIHPRFLTSGPLDIRPSQCGHIGIQRTPSSMKPAPLLQCTEPQLMAGLRAAAAVEAMFKDEDWLRALVSKLHLGTQLGAKFHFAGGGVRGWVLPGEPNADSSADAPPCEVRAGRAVSLAPNGLPKWSLDTSACGPIYSRNALIN
jgi:hypothetical protein